MILTIESWFIDASGERVGARVPPPAVLARALEAGLLRDNPARDVKLSRGAPRTHEPWTYLLPEEQTKLLSTPTAYARRPKG